MSAKALRNLARMSDCRLCTPCLNQVPNWGAIQAARKTTFMTRDNFGGLAVFTCPHRQNIIYKTTTEEPTASLNVKTTVINGRPTLCWSDEVKVAREAHKQKLIKERITLSY